MKLAVSLLMLTLSWTSVESGNTKSTTSVTSDEFLKRAALQLERLSEFRKKRNPQPTVSKGPPDDIGPRTDDTRELRMQEDILEAQKRIDDLRASASAVLRDPKYADIMQDRTKRSFISGIANQLIGGAVGAVSGLSRGVSGLSSSNSPSEYGHYGHSYESQFSLWDFKKAIINTLIQAIKAIGGGAIAGGGALIKGGGYLVTAKGRLISNAGDAITSLGKSLASSAVIAAPKPVYGPPGYSYDNPSVHYEGVDHSYDGPPPSAYAGYEDAYNADHSNHAAPSNDDSGDNDTGVLIVKETKPGHGNDEEHPPETSEPEKNPNLSALEESFGGPPKGISTATKIIGILNSGQPTTSEHHNQYQEENGNYYPEHKDQPSPSQSPPPSNSYGSHPQHNNQENLDNAHYQDYPTSGQAYDSYGIKLQPGSPQLTDVHTEINQPSHDNQHSLTLNIQGVLSPQLEVPRNEGPTVFKDSTSFNGYHYNENQHNSEPLKIPILDHQNNHLNSAPQDYQHAGAFDFYGTPNYGSEAQAVNTMIGLNTESSALPMLPHYESYPFNSPVGFGHHLHYPAATGTALPGVWARMNRRSGAHGNKMGFRDNGLQIQRSVGYKLMNSKLTRI